MGKRNESTKCVFYHTLIHYRNSNVYFRTVTHTEVYQLDPWEWKELISIILTRHTSFYESHLVIYQYGFRSGKGGNDRIYIYHETTPKKLLTSRIGNFIPALSTSKQRITTSKDNFSRQLEIVFQVSNTLNTTAEVYKFTKS